MFTESSNKERGYLLTLKQLFVNFFKHTNSRTFPITAIRDTCLNSNIFCSSYSFFDYNPTMYDNEEIVFPRKSIPDNRVHKISISLQSCTFCGYYAIFTRFENLGYLR